MKSDCRQILKEISAYLDGELEAAACATIEQHCADCASCAAVVAGLKETAGLCRQLGATPLPTPVLERARASVRRLLLLADAATGDE
jgi:Predicted transmembrane transcriptional regulator (anti-sigma factor)